MNLKILIFKNRTCYYFDDIIKLEDFVFDNTLTDERSSKKILFLAFHTKHCLVQNHCVLDLMKWIDLLELMMELDI